jgi:hypothetical protein
MALIHPAQSKQINQHRNSFSEHPTAKPRPTLTSYHESSKLANKALPQPVLILGHIHETIGTSTLHLH